MEIFEVIQLGLMPLNTDGGIARDTYPVLMGLYRVFYDANIALHLFAEASSALTTHMRSDDSFSALNGIPHPVFVQIPHMHGRSFVYAFDTFYKIMKTMRSNPDAIESLDPIIADFEHHFPGITAVRDSAHHPEDRIRGLERWGRPIVLQPISNESFEAPNGVLIIDQVSGSFYGGTAADGHYTEVEVSRDAMLLLKSMYQRVLNAFRWNMPDQRLVLPYHRPFE